MTKIPKLDACLLDFTANKLIEKEMELQRHGSVMDDEMAIAVVHLAVVTHISHVRYLLGKRNELIAECRHRAVEAYRDGKWFGVAENLGLELRVRLSYRRIKASFRCGLELDPKALAQLSKSVAQFSLIVPPQPAHGLR